MKKEPQNSASPRERLARQRLSPGTLSRRVFFVVLWGVMLLAFFPQTLQSLLGLFSSSDPETEYVEFTFDDKEGTSHDPSGPKPTTDEKRASLFAELDEIEARLAKIKRVRFTADMQYVDFAARDKARWADETGYNSPGKRLTRYLQTRYHSLREKWDNFSQENLQIDLPNWGQHFSESGMDRITAPRPGDELFFRSPTRTGFEQDGFFDSLPWIEDYAQSNQLLQTFYEEFSFVE